MKKTAKKRKRIRTKKGFDWHKFAKKGLIRLAYRGLELVTLLIIGSALGFKLIRY